MASVEGLRGPGDSWGALAFSFSLQGCCLLLVQVGTLVLGPDAPHVQLGDNDTVVWEDT